MILWCDGAHDPATNMARDAALLAGAEAGREPVLRLFRFAPHGITLGHAQDPHAELDLEACARDGVPWARRPTGGRAIFHAEEWTYSLASPIADPAWGGSLSAAYARVQELLLRSLVRLGIPAETAPGVRASDRAPRGIPVPCFATTTPHEIVLEGRKLIGSAQRRGARGLLQQGSLLLGPGHLRLADYVRATPEQREGLRASLAAAAADASAFVGTAPALERWADALAAELPLPVRRRSGEEGAHLLTLSESGSYTARSA